MSDNNPPAPGEHNWSLEALPWLLNGTLPDDDRRRLEAHLQHCPACREQLDRERTLARQMQRGPAVSHAPHASLAKLKARVRQQRTPPQASLLERLAGFARSLPWLYGAIAAQAVAIAVLLVAPAVPVDAPYRYQTMSSSESGVSHLPRLQVQFADTATVAEIREALGRINGSIASGPSVAGVMVITLRDQESATSLQALEQAAAILQQLPAVRVVAVQPATDAGR